MPMVLPSCVCTDGSHPSRVRGLKYANLLKNISQLRVAPFAGAWIEMERAIWSSSLTNRVAPFAGAWIEIDV